MFDEKIINEKYQKTVIKKTLIKKIESWILIGTIILWMILIIAFGFVSSNIEATSIVVFTIGIALVLECIIFDSLIDNIYIPPKSLSLTKDFQNKIIKDLLENWNFYEWEYTKLHDFIGYQTYYCEKYILIGNYLMYDDNISLLITTNGQKRYANEVYGMEDVEMFILDENNIQNVIKLFNIIDENYSQIALDRETSKKWGCLIRHIGN